MSSPATDDRRGGAFSGVGGKGHGRAATLAAIARDARLTRGYLLQVALATAIAHLGLLMNSAPVVIGAMLISPLLAPIMGAGFALATFDGRLLRRSLQTLSVGTATAIGVALFLTVLSPITDATPALLARVRPSLLDLMVAIFGGLAGAYALLRKFSATLVGVAIATALIPPLATVGWGLALGRYEYAGGALLLYVTNSAAIAFMATAVARFNGFGTGLSPRQSLLQSIGIGSALAILAVPLAFSLSAIVREARAASALRDTLGEMAGPEATIDRFDIDFQAAPPTVSAVVIAPSFKPSLEKSFGAAARKELGGDTRLSVIQLRNGTAESENQRTARAAEALQYEIAIREAQRLRAALVAAFDMDPDAVTIDLDRQRATVAIPAPDPDVSSEAENEEAPRTVLPAALRAAFPDWSIMLLRPVATPVSDARVAPAPTASPD
ncbi:hypothetical protein GCM10011515_25600 [Tsuneonella deserti]|uniref:DUF389 domain-containing protein n=1 Tax=Tsuneonella deserti TaxID=2035528 RepID=A0ABQ1SD45_9SPHN|nr:TIGR00341 family protein [Tsuneonella deserti]GGE04908.1 hypothetical protein GCM10011515_25600 [Tsuneonella deserti]